MSEEQVQEDGQEPSMEDILASIRRILAEDEDGEGEAAPEEDAAPEMDMAAAMEGMEAEAEPAPEPEPEPEPEMDMSAAMEEMAAEEEPEMDMSAAMEEMAADPEPEPAPEPVAAPAPEPMAAPAMEPAPAPEAPAPEAPVMAPPPPPPAAPQPAMHQQPQQAVPDIFELTQDMVAHPDMMSGVTMQQSTDLLGDLARAIIDRRDMKVTSEGTEANITLEGLVREMLNPLLREWLDRNLPYLIERLVKKEIDHMVNRAQRLDDSF